MPNTGHNLSAIVNQELATAGSAHTQNPLRAIVNARYNMAAFSVDDRKRPGPDRRSREISKVISEALEKVILLERFPRAAIDVDIEVLKMKEMLGGDEPDIDIGEHCSDPYNCEFIGHCWKHIPENSVFDFRGRGVAYV